MSLIMKIIIMLKKEGYNMDNELSSFSLYKKELSQYEIMTEEEFIKLIKEYKETKSTEIKNKIIEGNLRLVMYEVNNFSCNDYLINKEDLIQIANLALIEAIEKFDLSKNISFSTYAVSLIRFHLMSQRSKEQIPVSTNRGFISRLYKYKKLKDVLIQEGKINYSYQEIANALNLKLEDVLLYESSLITPMSLNKKYYDFNSETEVEYQEFIVDEVEIDAEIIDEEVSKKIKEILSIYLTEKEKDIIQDYFGLNNRRPKKVKEIALKYGVTRQAIEKTIKNALKKLKNKDLISFYMN
ncbi:MAG: sigma-70 family RNA polymerase sigma factor [Firmicutes bacterium]|nr:sigma-70 family RNA polymerase sigma factor [Bacillota bacterium]